jgi:hypothetical protein
VKLITHLPVTQCSYTPAGPVWTVLHVSLNCPDHATFSASQPPYCTFVCKKRTNLHSRTIKGDAVRRSPRCAAQHLHTSCTSDLLLPAFCAQTYIQLLNKFPAFCRTKCSLPCSQQPATCLWSEPDQSMLITINVNYVQPCVQLSRYSNSLRTGSNPGEDEIIRTRPDRPWGLPNGYWVSSLGVERPGRDVDHSPTSSAEVKEKV